MAHFKKFLSKASFLAGGAVLVLVVAFFLGKASVGNDYLARQSQETRSERTPSANWPSEMNATVDRRAEAVAE